MDSHLGLRVEHREDVFVCCSGLPLVVAFHIAVRCGTMRIENESGSTPDLPTSPGQLYTNLFVLKQLHPTVA